MNQFVQNFIVRAATAMNHSAINQFVQNFTLSAETATNHSAINQFAINHSGINKFAINYSVTYHYDELFSINILDQQIESATTTYKFNIRRSGINTN